MQIQISWLLQKPTDLDLHCLQNRVYPGSAGQGLTEHLQLDKTICLKYMMWLNSISFQLSETVGSKFLSKNSKAEFQTASILMGQFIMSPIVWSALFAEAFNYTPCIQSMVGPVYCFHFGHDSVIPTSFPLSSLKMN